MSAIAAVDTALWDIKGKVAGLPVYQLLGGRCREGVTVYGHANARDRRRRARPRWPATSTLGYRAVRVQTGVPGLADHLRRQRGPDVLRAGRRGAARPRRSGRPPRYLAHVPSVFARVREEFGPDLRLLHDVHHRLTPIEAARLGKSLEPYDLTWLEDPVPAELQEGFRLIRQHTTTPIAVGEVFNSIWDCQQLITEQLIDYIRATVVHAGGISHLRRIFDLAALHHVRSGSHGATDLSPVCMAAALHLDLSIPNFGLQEYMRHTRGDRRGLPARLPLRRRLPAPVGGAGARASTSTRSWRRGTRTTRRPCRSTASRTARCTAGNPILVDHGHIGVS